MGPRLAAGCAPARRRAASVPGVDAPGRPARHVGPPRPGDAAADGRAGAAGHPRARPQPLRDDASTAPTPTSSARPGSGQAVLVDPGPDDAAHLAAVRGGAAPPGTPGASPCWSPTTTATTPRRRCPGVRSFGAQVAAGQRRRRRAAAGGCWTTGTGWPWPAPRSASSPRPGTPRDHLAFRLESGAVLVGDHVLGRGTSVVTHPEGDVVAYLESLRRVHDLGPSALYCGHGPELTEDPGAVLDFYLAHRAYREHQLLARAGGRAGDRRRAGRARLRRGAARSCGRPPRSRPAPRWPSCAPRAGSRGHRGDTVRLA